MRARASAGARPTGVPHTEVCCDRMEAAMADDPMDADRKKRAMSAETGG